MDRSFNGIMQRQLSRVKDNVDKREGSMIHYALGGGSAELSQAFSELLTILDETYADKASRPNLIRRAAERNVFPEKATKGIHKGVFNMDIPIGARFTGGGYIFVTKEKITTGEFKMECEALGSSPNTYVGDIVPIEYIEGLITAKLTEVLIPGGDEEETEALRKRFFASYDSQAFGGNRADYLEKTNKLLGVGGTKVYRTPSGGGTVGLVIMDNDYGVPNSTLISTVQTAIDPIGQQGEGMGLAPIDHVVTVSGVTEEVIPISTTITYASGWDWAALESHVNGAIDKYFLELKKNWQHVDALIVRISQIENRLLDLTGVIDISGTQIAGTAQNKTLGKNMIPKRGAVSV